MAARCTAVPARTSACVHAPRPSLRAGRRCHALNARRSAASDSPTAEASEAGPDRKHATADTTEAAAAAAASSQPPAAAECNEEAADDEFLDLPEAQHILLEQDFLDVAPQLREHYEERVGSPLKTTSDRFCWDHWHVPGQYNLMRTPADRFFPPDLYNQLVDALVEYGERVLGCRGISPIWLSYYVHGHRQLLHSDAPHGPFAFVLSLTRWDERRFSGGETMLLQPWVLDYWRSFDPQTGTETPQLMTLVPPRFNQLTCFDGRIPHGVQQVEGTHDPLEARVVLHGWFTSPAPFFAGSLSEDEATPALNACLEELYAALGTLPPAVGTVTLRLDVAGDSGKVRDIVWLANTLVARPHTGEVPEDVCGATLATIAEHLFGARFPPSTDGGATAVTLPFIFE